LQVGLYADPQQNSANRPAIVAEALDAAGRGFAVFPLSGKAPALKKAAGGRGYKDASRDPETIISMFSRAWGRVTGYGIACGQRSRIVVADIDSREGIAEAKRRGLKSDYVVRSGRDGDAGWHVYMSIPQGVEVKSGDIAPGLRLQAEGCYVVAGGSVHPCGRRYAVVKDGEPSPAPAWVLEPRSPETGPRQASDSVASEPVSIAVSGPPILKGDPGRNLTLVRIAGRLHDSSRSLADLIRDLEAINRARCRPVLPTREVESIARSIHARKPCKPRPQVSETVLARAGYLRERAEDRPIRGKGGASGWCIYHAGLRACEKWGAEHPEGIALKIDMRTLAQMSAKDKGTVSRWVRRSPMVRVLRKGSGRRPSTLLFVVPKKGVQLQQSSSNCVGLSNSERRSVAVRPLFTTLSRSRWAKRRHKPRRGIVPGTAKVYDFPPRPASEGRDRIGPSRAALLWKIHAHPSAKRSELAAMMGIKPDSLKKRLKWLHDAGLIVRTGHGRYAATEKLERQVEDARELAGEPEDDRAQIGTHAREREAYRRRNEKEHESEPTEAGLENVRNSRERLEQFLREQQERAEQERRTVQPSEDAREKRRRVDKLVRQGTSRRWAEAAVYDPWGDSLGLGLG
jgi:DNA-binding MarR family transcriptional regulator